MAATWASQRSRRNAARSWPRASSASAAAGAEQRSRWTPAQSRHSGGPRRSHDAAAAMRQKAAPLASSSDDSAHCSAARATTAMSSRTMWPELSSAQDQAKFSRKKGWKFARIS
ncbi:Os12g0482550 [Oryza sativa Japonica Group]|uniref:Os12g0482550 protein n=1 Tax=Oryza sativa subsp. japonica TaxID=39947 RepID=A0A0P0YAT1_ORYSJ|nr:Os12g0482550 [Oryza sativa Japonica Group]